MPDNIHEIIEGAFSPLYTIPCWSVRQTYGSSLYFEFGEPHLRIQELKKPRPSSEKFRKRVITVSGAWHLWIDCCYWNLVLDDKVLAHTESSRKQIEDALAHVDGETLLKVSVEPHLGRSEFVFELGGKLITHPYEDLDSEGEPYSNWRLFSRGGNVLTYRADGKYSYGNQNESSSEWL